MIIIAENERENELVQRLAKEHHGRAIERDCGYAMTVWSIEDIKSKHDMTNENARQFLEDYERRLAESAISGGWDFIDYADVSQYVETDEEDFDD